MKAFLGIDSSCYTTSCALVDETLKLLTSQRMMLKVAQGERGLRQSEAVFAQMRQLPEVLERTLTAGHSPIAAICVSDRPCDEAGAYMPVFQAGYSLARSLSAALGVPLFTTTHQRGHIAAASYGLGQLSPTYLALHLSGGTTDLLKVSGEALHRLGSSLDLHAGQLIDRVGVALALPFPSGPHLEALARDGKSRGRYPVSVRGLDCHLSGVEAQALRDTQEGEMPPEDVAAEVFDLVARTVVRLLNNASEATGIHEVLVFGGVASSGLLREMIARRTLSRHSTVNWLWGDPELSGDNAVGTALIGARQYLIQG